MEDKASDLNRADIIRSIQNGSEATLRTLYDNHRPRFVAWFLKNHSLDETTVIEMYQQAFTIFYFNVKDGKLTTLQSSIETYLIGIGKNLMKAEFRSMGVSTSLDEIHGIDMAISDIEEAEAHNHKKQVVQSILEKIKDPCKSILEMYYFKNFSMEIIAQNMGYKDASIAKKKKCLCLQQIRKQLQLKK